jgi:hypothetical protein
LRRAFPHTESPIEKFKLINEVIPFCPGKKNCGEVEVSNAYENHEAGFRTDVAPSASVGHARRLLRMAGSGSMCGGYLGSPAEPQ